MGGEGKRGPKWQKVGGILAPDLEGVNKQELCGKDLWDITIIVNVSNFGANIKQLIAKDSSCSLIHTFLCSETILVSKTWLSSSQNPVSTSISGITLTAALHRHTNASLCQDVVQVPAG